MFMKLSKEEQNLLNVLKMNQDKSNEAKKDINIIDAKMQKEIEKNEKLITLLENQFGINTEILAYSADTYKREKSYDSEASWNDLVIEANKRYSIPVAIDDLLTENEIKEAMTKLDTINEEFAKKTSILNKTDISFLLVATALQVTKTLMFPYLAQKFDYGNSFDPEERLQHDDSSIKKAEKDAKDNYRDKKLKKNPTGKWINILYQTVPYDITKGSPDINVNLHGQYHRLYTLGHDPILGWIFGTANILTDCCTFNTFLTHRVQRIDPYTGAKNMKITEEVVPLSKMFKECYDEARSEKLMFPAAIFAQAQHLKSDEYTKLGLPVPILSTINEEFASKLYSENYDALCFKRDLKIVGSSFVISRLIDIIISLVHGLFRKEWEKKDLFEVRTRKILLLSNSLAGTSTVIDTLITKNPRNLDIGGLLNLVARLFTDIRFVTRIKQEYIESVMDKQLQKMIEDLDNTYNELINE